MVTKNSIDSNIPIELSIGGTNAASLSTSLGVTKYDGTRIVSSSTYTIDSSNIATNTAQPAFLTETALSSSNVTGDGTTYQVLFPTAIFDQNANIGATSIFTAPVTGVYFLNAEVLLSGIDAAHDTLTLSIVTTLNTFSYICNPYKLSSSTGELSVKLRTLANMTATNTAYVTIAVSGGTKVIGNSATYSLFSGYLKC